MVHGIKNKVLSIIFSTANAVLKSLLIVPRGTCRFYPSCSNYAQEALQKLPAHVAVFKIFIRILRCNPLSKGGYDPVVSERKVPIS